MRRNITGVFLNYYKDGTDYAAYHADKYNCDCILLSFGETRKLRYKHNTSGATKDFILRSGDFMFIPNRVNDYYKHSLLAESKHVGSRISVLMFCEN